MSTRFSDPSGRGPSGLALVLRGAIYLSLLALVATLLLMRSEGAFRQNVHATAVVADVGDGLPDGSEVKLNGVLVGKVETVRATPGTGRHEIRLNLEPRHAERIPASVRARILPSNVFGAPYVDLVPRGQGSATLAEGATIPADNSREAVQLQTAITNTRDVLEAVRPAKLNVALSNLSQALRGKGEQLGRLIRHTENYMSELQPHTATLGQNLGTLASVLENLRRNAPDLLDTVDSALVTSKTIVQKQQQLARTLTGGAVTVDKVHGLMNEHAERGIEIVRDLAPVVGELGEQGPRIPVSFKALGRGVGAFVSAFDKNSGWLRIDMNFTGAPFTPYTAADCPKYDGVEGPNCDDPVPEFAQPRDVRRTGTPPAAGPAAGQRFGGLVGPVGSRHEKERISSIVGSKPDSLSSLMFGPLLRGATVTGSR